MKTLNPSQDLRISGYASVFNRRDLSGDIVRRGAFSASLLKMKRRRLPDAARCADHPNRRTD